MENLSIEQEALAVFEATLKKIVIRPKRKLSEKTWQFFKENPDKLAGIYGLHSKREVMLSEITALVERARTWPKRAKKKDNPALNAYLIPLTPEQWWEVNRPLTMRLGGQV